MHQLYNYNKSDIQVWERAGEAICEQTLADISFLTINEGKLKLSDI